MPLAQSIQYIWVTCVSIVAFIATYQLATQSLSIFSGEEALRGFDGTEWLGKFSPAANSVPATFRENDLQNGAAVAIQSPTTSNLTVTLRENDPQNGTAVAIPTSTTLNLGVTHVPAENWTSDAPAEGINLSSAEHDSGQPLHEDGNTLWRWFNKMKTAVNTTLFRTLSILCFMLPPICLRLRNSWFDIELYGRIEKGLRPSLPAAKVEEPPVGILAGVGESAAEDCETNRAGFNISTMSKRLHDRDQIVRHVQRKQTAKAEQRHRRALEGYKNLNLDFLETGKAVLTKLKQLEAEVATLRKPAFDFATAAPLPATPSLSATRPPATLVPSSTTRSNAVLLSPTSPQGVSAPTTPAPTQPGASPPLQPSAPFPRQRSTSMGSASDAKGPSPCLPPSKRQGASTSTMYSPTRSAPPSRPPASPQTADFSPTRHLPTLPQSPRMRPSPASGTSSDIEALGALEPKSRGPSKCEDSKDIGTNLLDLSPPARGSFPSSISRAEQGPSPPRSPSSATKEKADSPKPVLEQPVPSSGQSKARDVPKRGPQRPGARPKTPGFLEHKLAEQNEPKAAPLQGSCPSPAAKGEDQISPKPEFKQPVPPPARKGLSNGSKHCSREAAKKAEIPAFLAQKLAQKDEPRVSSEPGSPPSRPAKIPSPAKDKNAGHSGYTSRQHVVPPKREGFSNTDTQRLQDGQKHGTIGTRGKPKIPAFLMQNSAQQNETGAGPEPTTPSRLDGMVYDTNIPAKKTVCEADKMCSSRVCGKAHHGPRVHPSRPFTIEAFCSYDQNCKSRNCDRWHGSPASADRQLGN